MNKSNVAQVARSGLMFGLAMGLFIGLSKHDPMAGVFAGVATGLAFGIAITVFLELGPKPLGAADLDPGETLLHAGRANHFRGLEAVGGSLALTSKRLRFRSHKINVANHDESIAIDHIKSVEPARTLGIVPNGVLVHLDDGKAERFVVNDRAVWLRKIREVI